MTTGSGAGSAASASVAISQASRRIRLPNVLASVTVASEWVRTLAHKIGLDETEAFRLDLCLAEVLTNALSYGGLTGVMPPIEITCAATREWVRCTVIEAGAAFDPVGTALPPLPESLDHGSLGGAGLRLLHEFCDECDYERRGQRNVLHFMLYRKTAAATHPSHWHERGVERRQSGRKEDPAVRDAAPVPAPASAAAPAPMAAPAADQRKDADRRALGYISSIRLFRGAPYSAVEPIVANCHKRTIAAGEIWLAPGERSPDVAIVLKGRLRVHVERPDSRPTFIIDVGQCAGEMQLLDGKPASAYVIADIDSELLLIPAPTLLEQLLAIPQVAANLLAILAGRIRRSDRLIAEQVRDALELERLQRELMLAQEIQLSMLPQPPLFPELHQLECAGFIRATKEVGGDFYDAFALDANRVFITIGDICGKGLPASLFMVRALTTLWNETARRRGAQKIVEFLNRHLCTNNESGLFVSLFCGVLDLTTWQFTYVNAGHNPPLLAIGDQPLRTLDEPRNIVIGVAPHAVFRAGSVTLAPGSLIVLYTDGVTESESKDGRWFGDARLVATVNEGRHSPVAELTSRIVEEVDEFARGAVQADDITLLLLRVGNAAGAGV